MAAVSSVVDVDAVVDSVSSVISQCRSMEHSGSGDLSDLDMILVSIMSSSSQVGVLLDEILVTRQRHVVEEVVIVLRQLHMCLNQLCLEYETKLFIVMSMSPGRSAVSTTATSECTRGRPKKIINISLVWLTMVTYFGSQIGVGNKLHDPEITIMICGIPVYQVL